VSDPCPNCAALTAEIKLLRAKLMNRDTTIACLEMAVKRLEAATKPVTQVEERFQ